LHQSQQSQWSIPLVFIVFIVHKSFFNHVKAEVATGCAKHANAKADVAARRAEVVTDSAGASQMFKFIFKRKGTQLA
jgi:hypothetical protein